MREIIKNRNLIWKLAKNDFKKRYAGSYLGTVWAMIQPVVTVLMYWFVFDRLGFMRDSGDVPYVLFLTAGLVPWFFFSEMMTNATASLTEYNYLVKKVVFNIDILPIIRVVAATFIHAFFVCVLLIIACVYGYYPSLYTLQVIFYSFALMCMTLGICYFTSAVVVFFRDLAQIINICLQVGMWATPVLWNIDSINPAWAKWLKINPLCYVVQGYRGAVYGRNTFIDQGWYNLYFWGLTVVFLALGKFVFKKMKPHFADVL